MIASLCEAGIQRGTCSAGIVGMGMNEEQTRRRSLPVSSRQRSSKLTCKCNEDEINRAAFLGLHPRTTSFIRMLLTSAKQCGRRKEIFPVVHRRPIRL